MNKKFNERDLYLNKNFYKNVYRKSHLTENGFDAYSGIINSIKIDYLYEYLEETDAQMIPRDMEDINNMGISPLDAIRSAINGRSYIGGEFNLKDNYFVVENDENFLSIPERSLRKYLEEAIDNNEDFIQWCEDKGYVGRDSIAKANRDYYIGDDDWD